MTTDYTAIKQKIETRLTVPALALSATLVQLLDDLVPGHGLDTQTVATGAAAVAAATVTKFVSKVITAARKKKDYDYDGPEHDGCSGPNREWAIKGV